MPLDPQKKKAMDTLFKNVTGQKPQEVISGGLPPIQERINQLKQTTERKPFLSETVGDIKQFGKDFKTTAEKRLENVAETRKAMESGEIKGGEALFQTVGQVAGLGADQIGNLFKLGIKAMLPQKAEDTTKQVITNLGKEVVKIPEVQSAINWYSNLDENQKRNIDAVGGIVSLVSEFVGAGTGGRVAQTAKQASQKAIGVATDVAENVVRGTVKTAGKIGAEMEGALTGTSAETLEVAFDAVKRGGKSADEFTKALRNQIEPETIAENARNAVQTVKTTQQQAFRNSFEPIKNTTVNTRGVINSFTNELSNAGIKVKNGVLDFANSKLRTTPQAMNKLQSAFEEISRIGDSATLEQIDTSRQALKGLRLAGDDASANLANKFIDDATRIVRGAGEKVEGYKKLLDDFATEADFIDQLERDLMTGNKRTIDQTYRRLTTSLKTNNEARMKLLQELDEATDGVLLSQISGQQLSEVMPRGIIRSFSASLAGAGLATGFAGSGVGFAMIPMLVTASPRVVGEFIRALGITATKAKSVIEAINTVKKTLSKTYNVPVNELGQLFGLGVVTTTKNNTKE